MATATAGEVQFPTPTAIWAQPTEWKFMSTQTGTGNIYARGGITKVTSTDPDQPPIGSDVDFPDGQLVITVADSTEVPAAGAQEAVRGIVNRTGYIRLFDTNGDELSGGAYIGVEIVFSDWTVA